MSPLPDVIAVFVAAGGVIGAAIGLAFRPSSDREMIRNIVDGAQLGAVAGALGALIYWIGGTAAGA